MPMIEAKVTVQLPAEKRDVLKTEFGKAISVMGKPESYLMINLLDNQDLYFAGKKLEKGAYIEVKVLGSVAKFWKKSLEFLAILFTYPTGEPPIGAGTAEISSQNPNCFFLKGRPGGSSSLR